MELFCSGRATLASFTVPLWHMRGQPPDLQRLSNSVGCGPLRALVRAQLLIKGPGMKSGAPLAALIHQHVGPMATQLFVASIGVPEIEETSPTRGNR